LRGEVCDRGLCRDEPECLFADECGQGLDCVNNACVQGGGGGGEGEGEGEGPRAGLYGDECRGGAQCESDLCLNTAGGGRCTQRCANDAQCPGLDVCTAVGNRAVCAPNDAGGACRDPIECNFGLCINDPGAGSAVCSLPCDDQARCPQNMGCGLILTAQGDVLWACVPTGGNCNRAFDCATSRCVPDGIGENQGYCSHDCRNDRDCTLGNRCCPVQDGQRCVNICVRGAVCPG
jgi:hypothetical protein